MTGEHVETVLIIGVVASSALWIGSLIGILWSPPQWFLGMMIAFASGALITALGEELFGHAIEVGGIAPSAIGLIAGALIFLAIDTIIERKAGEESGLGLLAGVTIDGVPENLALGVALVGHSSSAILPLVAAIFVSNLPEALSGSSEMRDEGFRNRTTLGLWGGAGFALILAAVIGHVVLRNSGDDVVAIVQAMAGGGVLASLAVTLMPQAYHKSHELVGFATVAGFLLTFLLK